MNGGFGDGNRKIGEYICVEICVHFVSSLCMYMYTYINTQCIHIDTHTLPSLALI